MITKLKFFVTKIQNPFYGFWAFWLLGVGFCVLGCATVLPLNSTVTDNQTYLLIQYPSVGRENVITLTDQTDKEYRASIPADYDSSKGVLLPVRPGLIYKLKWTFFALDDSTKFEFNYDYSVRPKENRVNHLGFFEFTMSASQAYMKTLSSKEAKKILPMAMNTHKIGYEKLVNGYSGKRFVELTQTVSSLHVGGSFEDKRYDRMVLSEVMEEVLKLAEKCLVQEQSKNPMPWGQLSYEFNIRKEKVIFLQQVQSKHMASPELESCLEKDLKNYKPTGKGATAMVVKLDVM